MFLSLLIAASAAFSVSDTTDNDTNIRTVYALNLDISSDYVSALYIRCTDGQPHLYLELLNRPKSDWLTATVGSDVTEITTPHILRWNDDLHSYLFYENSEGLYETLKSSHNITIKSYQNYGEATAVFKTDGFEIAWKRVADACKLDP